jgi:hypothetical protein
MDPMTDKSAQLINGIPVLQLVDWAAASHVDTGALVFSKIVLLYIL